MRVMVGLMVLLLLLAGALLPGPASAKSAGDSAFLTEHAESVEGLVKQVENSRLLVLRYAKFFTVDPSNVISYFRDLSIEEVKQTTTLDVYHRKGMSDVESKTKQFKAGTKVFVNRNGIPILELGTGNPLADTLPGKDVKQLPPKTVPETTQPVTASNQPTPQVGPQPTTAPQTTPVPNELPTTVPGSQTSPLGNQTVASTAGVAEPETAVLGTGPIETVAKAASKGKGISALSGWLLPVGLAGAALAGGGSGGSGSTDPINPVPEPAGLVALSTGLVAIAGTALRRRYR